jgi:acetylglutamate kinase
MIATAYLLFAISSGQLPVLTGLAAYESKEACEAAAATVTAALASDDSAEKIVCISADSLTELGKTNGLGNK